MRQRVKQIVFVCSAIIDNQLVSKMIEASSLEESRVLFEQDTQTKPEIIFGPFYKKRTAVLEKNRKIQFKPNQSKRIIYNGWYVTAMALSNPPDSVYLFYDKRVDGQKLQKPNISILKTTELQDQNEKIVLK